MVRREFTAVWQVPFSKWVGVSLLSGTRRRFTQTDADEGTLCGRRRGVVNVGVCRRREGGGREGREDGRRKYRDAGDYCVCVFGALLSA